MALLKKHAQHLIQTEPESDHLPLMRNKAGELDVDLDVKDSDLQLYLDQAEWILNPPKVYRGGDKLQATEPVFLLDGLIQLGETTLIVGQPKVGKSSFMVGFAAALRDRKPQFLGRDILLPSERMPVLLFGTDQSEGNWLHFLRREGITGEDQSLDANALDFFCDIGASNQFNFTKDGLRNMRQEIDQHQFPLVIIDSLSSMMEPTGIEENTTRFAQPIRNAIRELRKTGATLVILHHTVKRPTGWDWISECRGSSSITSVMSWGVLMRYVSQEEEGLARTDKRVGFSGKGRGSGESGGVMGIYQDEGGWTFLDGLERAQAVSRIGQKIGELGGVRAQVFDYLTMRTEIGADVSADELATELNKIRSHMSRELNTLQTKGLAVVTRKEPSGSRPRRYWALSEAAAEWSLRGSQDGSDGLFGSFAIKTIKTNSFNSQELTAEQLAHTPDGSFPELKAGTPVQRLVDGNWQGGWLVHDGQNPDAVTITKLGTPSIIIRNLRWHLDLRPATNPYPSQPAELPF